MFSRKGLDLLLLAFDRLVQAGLDVRLLLVGRQAELPNFLATVSPFTRSRILYEGFQAPEHLPKYFGESDVFVLPSRHDGWGVVINQALAAGLPIITSNAVGAGLDLVEHGINECGSPLTTLARCIKPWKHSPGTLTSLASVARGPGRAFGT
jgi:glycosyltransferase involved in cell wall biosynthesis